MKSSSRNTVLVGFAFLSICAFWQMYNNVIPLILTNTFHMNETISGVIMAADNVLGLFLLPLFGAFSDRSHSRFGRRMPFIVCGTAAAIVLLFFLPILDNSYAASPAAWKLAAFIAVLFLLLLTMGTYRSPAVALMPDVTPKPLRSRANAIINLMGAVGGVLYLLLASFLYSAKRTAGQVHVDYFLLFASVAAVMALSIAVLFLTVRENCLAEENRKYEAAHPEENVAEDARNGALAPAVRKSLGFLLLSIALWFIGYNAIETWFTTYAARVWGMPLGESSVCLTIATVGAIVSYLPIGAIATRVGRKKTILAGIALLTACFFVGFLYAREHFSPLLYLLFALVGLAWAAINVNSLPMVVEMCKSCDVGKFTGYYYAFSMAAQTITPIAAGALLKNVGYIALFPYAAFFVAASFVTMLFVHHGDNRMPQKIKKRGNEFE